jgi:hypothetical protein
MICHTARVSEILSRKLSPLLFFVALHYHHILHPAHKCAQRAKAKAFRLFLCAEGLV